MSATRVLGVDLGSRRVGLALSDPLGVIASPLAVLERDDDVFATIVAAAREHDAGRIVVGLPRSLAGGRGPAAAAAEADIAALRAAAGADLVVESIDERLTTVIAHDQLARTGIKPGRRRAVVDQVAAAVILQSWLDRRASTEGQR